MKVFAVILWLLTLGCWGIMLLMTHGTPDEIGQMPVTGLNDNVDHFLAFGLLGGLLSLSLWAIFPQRPSMLWLTLPILLLYGLIDEKTRSSVSSAAQMRHWLADAAGTGLAVVGIAGLYGLSCLLRPSAKRQETRDRSSGLDSSSETRALADGLGGEVESALASYGQADADVGEPIIRVEKTSVPLPKPDPIRVRPKRLR